MKNIPSAIAMIAWSVYALAGAYTVAQLGLLPGGTRTYTSAINKAGQVVGMGDTYSQTSEPRMRRRAPQQASTTLLGRLPRH
jgi:hypothetical protein